MMFMTSTKTTSIGYSLATAGAISALIQVAVMPHLLRIFGTLGVYNFSMSLWAYAFLVMPLINLLARCGATTIAVWFGLALSLGFARGGNMAYS